jgi:hypothetical protein
MGSRNGTGRMAPKRDISAAGRGDVCIADNLNMKSVAILMRQISILASASPYILHVPLAYGPISICIRSGFRRDV